MNGLNQKAHDLKLLLDDYAVSKVRMEKLKAQIKELSIQFDNVVDDESNQLELDEYVVVRSRKSHERITTDIKKSYKYLLDRVSPIMKSKAVGLEKYTKSPIGASFKVIEK